MVGSYVSLNGASGRPSADLCHNAQYAKSCRGTNHASIRSMALWSSIADRLQHPSKPHSGTQFDCVTEGVVMFDRSSALVEIQNSTAISE